MEPAILVAATALVLATAIAGAALLRPESSIDAAVTVGVLGTAEIALVVGVPGALGHLRPGVVLSLTVLSAAAAIAVARHRGARLPWPRLSIGIALRDRWVAALCALAMAGLAWQAFVAAVLPVYSYDALTYHGTTLATWLQRGDIDPPALSSCCSHYPNTAELLSAWPMLLLGSDAAVDMVQLGFVVLAALAVAGLARSAGLARRWAVAAAALFTTTPIVLAQASTNYVDMMVTAWGLAALHGIVRFAATRDLNRLTPAAIAVGLLVGTKGTGVFWAVVLGGGTIVISAVSARRGWLTHAGAVRAIALVAGASIALGSYWYVRNWVDTGNPLHPFHIEVAGIDVFDGPTEVDEFLTIPDGGPDEPWPESVVRSWAADLDFWNQGPYDYQQRAGGLGPLWPWLGLPLLVPVSIALLRRRSAVSIALVLTAVLFAVQPYRWWSRFTVQLAALGAIAIVAAVAWARARWAAGALRAVALGLAAVGVALTSYAVNPASRAPSLEAADVVRLVGASADERAIGRLFFPEYGFVEQLPDDATVVVDIPAEPLRFLYPLFGPSWTREVIAADDRSPPPGTWVVTATGRPLDRRMRAEDRYELVFDVEDVRVWRPLP